MTQLNGDDWLKKYYGNPDFSKMTRMQAIKHSYKKWQGSTQIILDKYGLYWRPGGAIIDRRTSKTIHENNSGTCALCYKYVNWSSISSCEECPLYQTNGNSKCYQDYMDPNPIDNTPYTAWAVRGNAQPMIDLLLKTLKREIELERQHAKTHQGRD